MGLTKGMAHNYKDYEPLRGLSSKAERLEFREVFSFLDTVGEVTRSSGATKFKHFELKTSLDDSPFVPIIDGDLLAYAAGFASNRMLYGIADTSGKVIAVPGAIVNKAAAKDAVADMDKKEEESGSHIRYKVISQAQEEPVSYAVYTMKKVLENIAGTLRSSEFREIIILTGDTENFRKKINPNYKISRKDSRKPAHLDDLKKYLKDRRRCVESAGCEADDYAGPAGVSCRLDGDIPVYVTKDKDWKQLWGWHYNWHSRTLEFVSIVEAMNFLFSQIIQGDAVDDIKGIPKYGPKRADKALKPVMDKAHTLNTPDLWRALYSTASELYETEGLGYSGFKDTASLVYLWRKLPDQFPLIHQLPVDITPSLW